MNFTKETLAMFDDEYAKPTPCRGLTFHEGCPNQDRVLTGYNLCPACMPEKIFLSRAAAREYRQRTGRVWPGKTIPDQSREAKRKENQP